MVANTELYDILEVPPSCTAAEIKSAYRRLAMLHHPDKNPGASHEKFQALQGAYEILSDQEQRDAYDRFGTSSGTDGHPGQTGSGFGTGFDFGDIFGGGSFGDDFFFNGMGSSSRGGPAPNRKKRKTRGDDQKIDLSVSLEEAYMGREKTLEIDRQTICARCTGSGCKAGAMAKQCTACDGQGIRVEEQRLGPGFVTRRQVVCSVCKGVGETIALRDSCKKCKGTKTVRQKKPVTVLVERGARTGDRIVLRGEGEEYPGQQAGDIILVIHIVPHSYFKLIPNTNDLKVSISITLAEALLGFERVVLTHLDGRGLRVRVPSPGSPAHRVFCHGDELIIKGEGFPGRRSHLIGDLRVRILLEMPTAEHMASINPEQQSVLERCLPSKRPSIETQDLIEDVEFASAMPTRQYSPEPENIPATGDNAHGANAGLENRCYQQ